METPSEPPPPYGPPAYDEVVSDKIKSGETTSVEHFDEGDTSVNIDDENQIDNMSHSSHSNQAVDTTETQSVGRTSNMIVGYQDLPTVTI